MLHLDTYRTWQQTKRKTNHIFKMHVFRTPTFVFVTVQFFLLISCDHEDYDSYPEFELSNIDRSNYVDPHDMLNYDRQKIKAIAKEKIELKTHNEESTSLCKLTEPNLDTCLKKETQVAAEVVISEMTIQLNPEGQEAVNCSSCPKNTTLIELPFLGRFVKFLTATLQIKDKHIEDNDVLYIPLLAVVNKRTQFILSEITKEGEDIQPKNLADLDEILTNLLIRNEEKQNSFYLASITSIFSQDLFQLKDFVMLMFVCSLWFVLWLTFKGYTYSYILSRSFLPFFIVSWFWHWHYMLQKASAKRHSDMSKVMDIPATCNIEQLTAWSTIRLYLSKTLLRNPDPCEEYYRVLMTDPSYEVNPFFALTDMLTVGIFQPLGFIGTQVGSFFDGVLTSAGWMYKIPVLAAVLITIFMILLMCFRYEIRLPFIKFGPSTPLPIPPSEAIQSVQQPIAGPQNLQRESLVHEHNTLIGNLPALNRPISGTTQQYVYQEVTIKRSFSQVQPVEERAQDSVEDCQNSTVPRRAIEELVGSIFPIQTTSDTNPQNIVQAAESVSEDSTEGLEKKMRFEDSTTLTKATCKDV